MNEYLIAALLDFVRYSDEGDEVVGAEPFPDSGFIRVWLSTRTPELATLPTPVILTYDVFDNGDTALIADSREND